jgi:hypothetical protein
MESSPCPRRLPLACVNVQAYFIGSPFGSHRFSQDRNVGVTWRVWQDSNLRPAA